MPPLQLAGDTAHVLFVAKVIAKHSKREMKTSAE